MNKGRTSYYITSILFFLTGAAGLIFQVIWARRIALVFGSTIQSASTTVAAFMLGLGLGAWLAGKYIDRIKHHLRFFAIVTLISGLTGLVVTYLIPFIAPAAVAFSRNFRDSALLFSMLRFVTVFILLLVPCTAMGATLPILTHYFNRKEEDFGRILGGLYAINTLGAAAGAFSTDFLLVERFGVVGTATAAAVINAVVAGGVFLLAGKNKPADKKIVEEEVKEDKEEDKTRVSPLIYYMFAAAGFCGMAYEIIWTRMLVFFNGSDVFAFSGMLTTFLIGLVIGSFIISKRADKIKDKRAVLSMMLGTLGFISFLTIFSAGMIFPLRKSIEGLLHLPFQVTRFLTNAILLLPSTILLGAIFPLTGRILNEKLKNAGRSVGEGTLWNTAGSLIGSLGAGFIIIPALGLQTSLSLVSSVALLSAAIFLIGNKNSKPVLKGILGVGAILGTITFLTAPGQILIESLYQDNPSDILFLKEDKYQSVALIRQWDEYESDHVVNLITDGYNMASNNFISRRYAMGLGYVPAILHEDPKDVLIIAVGLSNTANVTQELSVTKKVDCVELSEVVIEAVKHLDHAKHALSSQKITVIIDDGRNYLLTTNKKYDVITAEPPPPIHAGIVNLYSKEYYELCKKRLNPGGVAAQWLPIGQMSAFEARTIIKAFQEVFPYTYLWGGEDLNICIVGSDRELVLDYPRLKKISDSNRQILSIAGLEDANLVAAEFLKGPESLKEYLKNTPPLTDNRPYIQYSRGNWNPDINYFYLKKDENPIKVVMGEGTEAEENRREFAEADKQVWALRMFFWAGSGNAAADSLHRAKLARQILKIYPENKYFRFALRASDSKIRYYEDLAKKIPANPDNWFELARINYYRSNYQAALDNISKAIENSGDDRKKFLEVYRDVIRKSEGDE